MSLMPSKLEEARDDLDFNSRSAGISSVLLIKIEKDH